MESKVRQRLHSGGVIGYNILGSWEVGRGVVIAMQALVVAANLAEVGGRPNFGDSALARAGDSWGVVSEVFQGGIADRVTVRHDVQLAQQAGLFEVAIGDVASGVLGADQIRLDVGRKGVPPVVASPRVVKVHAAHAGASGIGGAEQ